MTAGDAVRILVHRFTEAGIDDPRLDARLLVAHVLGVRSQDILLHPETRLDGGQAQAVERLAQRRAAREPVSRILGRRGFWTFDLAVTPETLDPRPDTETVVEAVLEALPDRAASLRILDLGTGSGCILLALLSEYGNATGVGVDVAPGALRTAAENAARLGLADRAAFRRGDWTDPGAWAGSGQTTEAAGLDGLFDVVVSNPPYIPNVEIASLAPEVRVYDPYQALAGGEDGLEAYRAIAPLAARLLVPEGIVAVEVGAGQASAVAAILSAAGFSRTWNRDDLAGVDRCVCAQ